MCKIKLIKYEGCGHLVFASKARKCKKAREEDTKFKECKKAGVMFSRKGRRCEDCGGAGARRRSGEDREDRRSDSSERKRLGSEDVRDGDRRRGS